LDRENRALSEEAYKFFLGIVLSGPIYCGRHPVSLTGSNIDGEVKIRRIGKLEHPKMLVGCSLDEFILRWTPLFGQKIKESKV